MLMSCSNFESFKRLSNFPTAKHGDAVERLTSSSMSKFVRSSHLSQSTGARTTITAKQIHPFFQVHKSQSNGAKRTEVKSEANVSEELKLHDLDEDVDDSASVPRKVPKLTAIQESESKILWDELNHQQKNFANVILERGENVFLTGSAGVGKSFLLKYIIQELRERYDSSQFAITASTGVAAARIGGQTIHSFAGFRRNYTKMSAEKIYLNLSPSCRYAWSALRVLIIDEISMLDAEHTDKLDHIGRRIKNQESLPFGGIQLIFCGDFYQLPPVSKSSGGKFAFESRSFTEFQDDDELSIKLLELTQVVRQKEVDVIKLLNSARVGKIQPKELAKLRQLNLKVEKSKKRLVELIKDGIEPTKLYCKNRDVDAENIAHLKKLPGKEYLIQAIDTCKSGGSVKEMLKRQISQSLPEQISLKVNAQVMCTRNMVEYGLVNGSRGIVTDLDEMSIPTVKFDNGVELKMERQDETIRHGTVTYTREQLPLRLAWAITIHKSQGVTLSRAILKLDDAFAYGQAYVALSRLSSFDGLFIDGENIDASHIKADSNVTNYYENARRPVFEKDASITTPYEKMSLERLKSIVSEKNLTDYCIGYSDVKDEYCKLLYWFDKQEENEMNASIDIIGKENGDANAALSDGGA